MATSRIHTASSAASILSIGTGPHQIIQIYILIMNVRIVGMSGR